MAKLSKVKQTGRESLHLQMDPTFRGSGKMINQTGMENIKPQPERCTKVIFNMVLNLERENYILMKVCTKEHSRIILSMVRES